MVQKYFHMIAVLIVFLAANKKKESDEKKYQNQDSNKTRGDSATVRNAIEKKIKTQKNKTEIGHQRDRDESFEAIH